MNFLLEFRNHLLSNLPTSKLASFPSVFQTEAGVIFPNPDYDQDQAPTLLQTIA